MADVVNEGDRVVIIEGAFKGEAGTVAQTLDSGAALIRLDIHENGTFQAEAGNYEAIQ